MIKMNAYCKKLSLKKNEIVPIIRHCATCHKEMGSNQMKTISFMNNNSLKGCLFFLAILVQSKLDYILAMRDFLCHE